MTSEDKKVSISISTGTIIKIIGILLLLGVLYLIKDVVAILFISLLLVSIFEPLVSWLTFRKIPKFLAIFLMYFSLVAVIALIFFLVVPPITDQISQLAENFPSYWNKLTNEFSSLNNFFSQYGIIKNVESSLANWNFQLPQSTGEIFEKIGDFFSNIFSFFVILVITFYFLVEEGATKKILRSVVPGTYLPYAYQLVNKIENKLGLWLRGQITLCFIIFLMVYLGLLSLGVKYALVLAIIAGILEFIPYLGPLLSALTAVILTFCNSPILALFVLALYIVIQLLENNILVPKVMQKAVGLNPIVSITALLIGGKLGGILGIILAIPVATALSVVVEDIFEMKKESEMKLED